MTVQRIWQRYALTPRKRNGPGAHEGDSDAAPISDILGIYLSPPVRAIVLGTRLVPRSGTSPHRGPVLPSAWRAAPTAAPPVVSALLSVGALPTEPAPTWHPGAKGLLSFLEESRGSLLPPDHALALVDPGGVFPEQSISPWRARHPRIQVRVAGGPEIWNRDVDAAVVAISHRPAWARGSGGEEEVARALRQYLRRYAAGEGEPFVWVARPRDAAAGLGRFRLRYDIAVTGHPAFITRKGVVSSMTASEMPDKRAREMARTVLMKSLQVRRGESILIETWSGTLPWANAFQLESLRLGAKPVLFYRDEEAYWAALAEGPIAAMAEMGRHERAALDGTDVLVSFFGPSDRARYHALPGATIEKLCMYEEAWADASRKAGVRGVSLALGRVSAPSAEMYGVDLETWKRELMEGTLADPRAMRRTGARWKDALHRGKEVTIRHANGTDLTLHLRGREVELDDGIVGGPGTGRAGGLAVLPAGIVRVALEERFAEGVFRSNVDSGTGLMDAVGEVSGGRWTFRGGKLERFSYDKGQSMFQRSFGAAPRGKEKPGFVSIGLNPAISSIPLMEDQGLGTITLQIGRNDPYGGSNKVAWWAWLMLRGADLVVDGRPLLKGGRPT